MIASTKDPIRKADGTIIGWMETATNGDAQIRDFYGTILGFYYVNGNYTVDFNLKRKWQGNTLGLLLSNN